MLESLLGVRMTLYLGPTVAAAPAPAPIVEALTGVKVTLKSEGRDGFQLTFTLGRGPLPLIDYPILANPLLRPFSRVIIQVWMGVLPEILIDGFITHHQVQPSNEPGGSTLTVFGQDVRVMMDMRELPMPYPSMTQNARVEVALAKYWSFLGMKPLVIPPPVPDTSVPTERIPVWCGTDLQYVESLAKDVGYVFYVEPTPVPMVNLTYWGPEDRTSLPQAPLSVNVGPDSNVESLDFNHNALAPSTVLGTVLDKRTGAPMPVMTVGRTRPPLAVMPSVMTQQPNVRSVTPKNSGGMDYPQAMARAQAWTDRESDALTVTAEIDVLRYGKLLRARRPVSLRGAGFQMDGPYYVKKVTHEMSKGEYKQTAELSREGMGSILPVLPTL